jgi:arginase
LWVHFDTDVIDAGDAPAMNFPTPNGPSISQLGEVFSNLSGSGEIAAVSISSWNPQLDIDGHSQEVAMALVNRLLPH